MCFAWRVFCVLNLLKLFATFGTRSNIPCSGIHVKDKIYSGKDFYFVNGKPRQRCTDRADLDQTVRQQKGERIKVHLCDKSIASVVFAYGQLVTTT